MPEFFRKLFDTSDFPARWNCGNWDSFHGWMHIVSDLLIWAAYFMIPTALAYYWWKKRNEMEFPKLFWLFGAFIFSCGITHFIEATIFYAPIYRVSGLMKLITATVSWMTLFAIIRITPQALTLPGRAKLGEQLQRELDKKHEIQEQLAESNRELEAYTARVSHDLRNPLSGLILLGDLALGSVSKGNGEIAAKQISSMIESLRSMEESVKELHRLSSAGKQPARMEPVPLEEILGKVASNLTSKINGSGAGLKTAQLPAVLGNETLLVHLFTNLIENSIKYGSLRAPEIRITGSSEPGEEIVTVTDNGNGIPIAELHRVFEENFRASNVGETAGTGIGLSLCRSIMEQHGGTISALPVSGQGAVIEMRFPKLPASHS